MNFREHCQHIVQSVPGATACVLMGFDGIPIDTFEAHPSTYDLPTLLTEYSAAALTLRHAEADQPESGGVRELVISTPSLTCVLRPLNEDYFLAVLLGPQAVAGKARYLMRMAAPELLYDLVN
jgi:predicted regulator of Ras-like GTPase activity (Roadblock/LC7/MglB family)